MAKRNRGKHPNDDKYFGKKWIPIFKEAVDDHSYLLTRGYSPNSALQIVGNRYKLNKRQRQALPRISASADAIISRKKNCCFLKDLKHQTVVIDGFNLLILLESAMSGAFIFKGRDGTYRDIASVHGFYKRVQHTRDAILLVGKILQKQKVKSVKWLLDKPVSNSGRLKSMLLEIAEANQFNWEVELLFNPDKALTKSKHIVISSDGWILDRAKRWFNLGKILIEKHLNEVNIFDV